MLSAGTFGHGGAFGTQGWIDPHKDLFIIFLIQRTGLPNGDASDMRKKVQQVVAAGTKVATLQEQRGDGRRQRAEGRHGDAERNKLPSPA